MTALLDLRLWLVAALAGAVLWAAAERARGSHAREELSAFVKGVAIARADAEAKQRETEAQRTRDVQEISVNAQTKINSLEDQLSDSRSAVDRLRNEAANAASRARKNSSVASAGPDKPREDAIDLFAQLLHRHSVELVEVGEYADRLRIAGAACESSYQALIKP